MGRWMASKGRNPSRMHGPGTRPVRTVASLLVSLLPPDRMRPTRLPCMASRSCIRAASAAAPAPSATLWVARKIRRNWFTTASGASPLPAGGGEGEGRWLHTRALP